MEWITSHSGKDSKQCLDLTKHHYAVTLCQSMFCYFDHQHIWSEWPQATVHSKAGVFQMSSFITKGHCSAFRRGKQLHFWHFQQSDAFGCQRSNENYLIAWQVCIHYMNEFDPHYLKLKLLAFQLIWFETFSKMLMTCLSVGCWMFSFSVSHSQLYLCILEAFLRKKA